MILYINACVRKESRTEQIMMDAKRKIGNV